MASNSSKNDKSTKMSTTDSSNSSKMSTDSSTATPTSRSTRQRRPKEIKGLNHCSKVGDYRLKKTRQIFELRSNSVDVDVHLLARRQSASKIMVVPVPCHKIFLRTCSYFSELLDVSPFDLEGQILEIDIDLEILEEILRYIYTGEININKKNLIHLFEASIKLRLKDDELMVKFSKFKIGPLINENNWLELLRIFNSAGGGDSCGKFLKEIFAFLREKSSEFMNWSSFLKLTFDEIRLILNAESRVFKNARDFQTTLLIWMGHDAISKAHLIIEMSKFNFMELPEIIDLEFDDKSKKENEVYEELSSYSGDEEDKNDDDYQVSNPGDCDSSSDSEDSVQPLSKRIRLNSVPALSLLFCGVNHLYNYSFQEKICRKLCLLPTFDLDGFSMVLANSNDKLYIMGGKDRSTTSFLMSNKVYSCPIADLQINKKVNWKNEHSFNEMANFSTIYINGCIYTIGGIYNKEEKNIFHKPHCGSYEYSLSLGEINKLIWKIAFTFNKHRSQCAVAMLNDNLYIIGGIGFNGNVPKRANVWKQGPGRFKHGFDDIAIDSVEVYNTIDTTLISVANLRLSRFDHQAVAFENKIFVIGGQIIKSGINLEKGIEYKFTDSVEIYNPVTKNWTDGPSLTVPRANFAAFVMDEKIFVLGGNNEKATMEVYNPIKNKWKLEPCGDFPQLSNFSKFLLIK